MNATSIATDEIRIYIDPVLAMDEFVIAPIADGQGITGEETIRLYDTELMFSAVTEYDSINGREGFRLRSDVDTDRFWELAALYEN